MGNEGVVAVEKALALLDCFRPGDESLTLTALAQLSGYHKTTVYRLMNSLERMNYVVRHEDGNYALGPRLLYLGKLYEQSFHLSRVVQPELQALSLASQESASWYVLEGGQRLCLFRAEASHACDTAIFPVASFRSIIRPSVRYYAIGGSMRVCRRETLNSHSTRQAHAIPIPLRLRCLSSAFTTSWLRR